MRKSWAKCLFSLSIVSFLFFGMGCGSTSDQAATENLSNVSSALAIPTAGGSSRSEIKGIGMSHRTDNSRAGCETVRTTKMVKSMAQFPRMMLCMFGAMEAAGLITRPAAANTYNYYQFGFTGGGRPSTFKFRYGNDTSGNLLASACQSGDTDNGMEFHSTKTDTSATITVTNIAAPPGTVSSATSQMVVTAKRNAEGSATPYEFQSATMQMTGGHNAFVTITKDTVVTVKERFSGTYTGGPAITRKLYAEFTPGGQGSTKVNHSGVGGGTTFLDSWTDASTFACVHPKTSGTHFTSVDTFDLSTLTEPVAPTFKNRWTGCEPETGKSFETVNPTASGQSLGTAMSTCFSTFGTSGSTFFVNCESDGGTGCSS